MAEAVSRRPLTAGFRVRSRVIPFGNFLENNLLCDGIFSEYFNLSAAFH